MKSKFALLQRIDNDRKVTKDTDYAFWYHLQLVLLLTLREQGSLSAMQYRHAEEKLNQQRLCRAKRLMERENK